MQPKNTKPNVNEHLANERTLLAWVRTGIGIMAFGFVVVKFSLFVREVAGVLGTGLKGAQYQYSAPIGILLVAVGVVCLAFSLLRYHTIARRIEEGTFRRSPLILSAIVILILAIGIVLTIYLIKTT